MRAINDLTISSESTIEHAIRVIDEGGLQIALLVDNKNNLLGTVTDGDIRRAILNGAALDSQILDYANKDFYSASIESNSVGILNIMRQKNIHQMPILKGEELVGIQVLDDLIAVASSEVDVVIMAGGLGTRLRPLTEQCPKPMLKVGDKPILEIIIESLVKQGLSKIYLSVNYLKEIIINHFGDGSQFGVEIEYLIEDKPLGTAGALALISKPQKNLLVMNGDVLTRIDYLSLIDSHIASQADCTVCVRKYPVEIPFGVVSIEEGRVARIVEKPTYEYFVNAGIYALNASALSPLKTNQSIDMPQMLSNMIAEKMNVSCFPVYEYWLDIGKHNEFKQAHQDYTDHFLK